MRRIVKFGAAAAAGIVATVLLVGAAANTRWNRQTAELVGRVLARAESGVADHAEADVALSGATGAAPDALPPPVARYLARAIAGDAGVIVHARIEQEGEFRMNEAPDSWQPFRAVHTARMEPPAFVWDASIRLAPLVRVRVRDSYIDGRGGMQASVGGLVTVADAAPDRGLDEGALHRYLAESPWYPTRLLAGSGISWVPGDDRTATATLVDGTLRVSATFHFDAAGDVVEIEALRARALDDGGYAHTRWIGRFGDHRTVAGFRVPTAGEVIWILAGEEYAYWRGRLTDVRYTTR